MAVGLAQAAVAIGSTASAANNIRPTTCCCQFAALHPLPSSHLFSFPSPHMHLSTSSLLSPPLFSYILSSGLAIGSTDVNVAVTLSPAPFKHLPHWKGASRIMLNQLDSTSMPRRVIILLLSSPEPS